MFKGGQAGIFYISPSLVISLKRNARKSMKPICWGLFFYVLLLLFASIPPVYSDGPEMVTFDNYDRGMLPYGVVGPESITLDCNGHGPYTGVADGRIFKWEGFIPGWKEFATTSPLRTRLLCDRSKDPNREPVCGRPLGLQFDKKTCHLYVADAYFGLMGVGPNGGQAVQLASSAENVPFRFTNSVDIDHDNGIVYFTDSSTRYQRREHLRAALTGDSTGRLMQYDIKTGLVKVLLKRLKYANGVSLSKDKSFVLVSEIGTRQILRYWLKGPKTNTKEVFSQLHDAPDNINRNDQGDFWVALNDGGVAPPLRDVVIAVKLNGTDGTVLQALHGDGILHSISEVQENLGTLFVGSIDLPYVAMKPI